MKNVGTLDRRFRALTGLILIIVAYLAASLWLAIPAVILLVTASVQFCPIYKLVGTSTLRLKTTMVKQEGPE